MTCTLATTRGYIADILSPADVFLCRLACFSSALSWKQLPWMWVIACTISACNIEREEEVEIKMKRDVASLSLPLVQAAFSGSVPTPLNCSRWPTEQGSTVLCPQVGLQSPSTLTMFPIQSSCFSGCLYTGALHQWWNTLERKIQYGWHLIFHWGGIVVFSLWGKWKSLFFLFLASLYGSCTQDHVSGADTDHRGWGRAV